jgi:hypothetical protein
MCPCCLLLCAERRCCPRCRCAQEPAREEGRPEGISHCSSVPFACCSGTAAAAAAILLAVTAAASQFEPPLCSCVWSGAGNIRWFKHLQVVLGHRLWQRPAERYPVSEQQQQQISSSQLPIPYTLQSTARKTTNEMNRLHKSHRLTGIQTTFIGIGHRMGHSNDGFATIWKYTHQIDVSVFLVYNPMLRCATDQSQTPRLTPDTST